MTQSLARLPPPNDIKQKSTSANIRFLEEFQSDGPQVIIILLKRVKTETVFKHQLPFYKIPTVSVKSYYKYIFLAPLSFPKECISMTEFFGFFFCFVLILHLQNRGMKKMAKNLPSSSQGQKTAFSPTAWDQGTGARTKYSTRENLGFRTLLHQERRGKQVGRCGSSARRAGSAAKAAAPSPPLPSTVAFFFLLLLHPPRAPRRRPGLPARHSRGRRAGGRAGGGERGAEGGGRAASPGAAPLRLRSGSAPGPARPGRRRERGRQLAAAGRPLARTPPRPPPAMSAAAGCRQSRCRPAAAGSSPPPLFFVRCERRRCCGARAEAPSLPRPLLRGEGPERWCPAPPRPPSVPPALSGSCLLLLLLLPVVQAPPSLLSFAARISLEFYSLPHVTHRVKLHLRRVTHQHSASPSRPGHRQQQPPPTEEPQPGSQPAPPSAECAAATHGNSRARPGAAREAPPPRWWRNLPKAFGSFRAQPRD